jgi:predicted RNase H-like HicB family nuclease
MNQAMARTYFAILHRDRDSAVGVVFPDLPGCFSAGDTYDEAIGNAAEALQLYAEAETLAGRKLPQPRSFEDLYAASEVRSEAAGAAFVAILLTNSMMSEALINGGRIRQQAGSDSLRPMPEPHKTRREPATKARKRKPSAG